MKKKELYICKICWFEDREPFWLETGWPTWKICPCCWAESWYDDITVEAVKRNRKKWLNSQIKWFEEHKKPKDWDFLEQIKNIPNKYI